MKQPCKMFQTRHKRSLQKGISAYPSESPLKLEWMCSDLECLAVATRAKASSVLWSWERALATLEPTTALVKPQPLPTLNLVSMPALLMQRGLRWFGHAARHPKRELIKDLLLPTPPRTWRRRAGGQMKTWATTITADLEPFPDCEPSATHDGKRAG